MGEKVIVYKRFSGLMATLCFAFIIVLSVKAANQDNNNPHNNLECATCHSLVNNIKNLDRNVCIGCHSDIYQNNQASELSFHTDNSRMCINCHSFHNTKYITVDGVKFQPDFKSEKTKTECIACHRAGYNLDNLSKGHQEARKLYHRDSQVKAELSPSQTCLECHGSSLPLKSLGFDIDKSDMPVINTHASHPFEINVMRGKGTGTNRIRMEIDQRISLNDNQIECQTCHELTSDQPYLVINFEKQQDICLGCHEQGENKIDLASTK